MFGLFPSKKETPRTERLRALSLFVNLTPRELKIVDGLLHERQFLKDEVIFDKGDEGQAIYIIIDGGSILPQGKAGDGQTMSLSGTFFGDLALLDNSVRSAGASGDDHHARGFSRRFRGLAGNPRRSPQDLAATGTPHRQAP